MVLVNIIIWGVDSLRLKIDLSKENFVLPIGYNHILQGTIYNMLNKKSEGEFYHNVGYKKDEKTFKLFVFSNLFGPFTIQKKQIIFKDHFCFYISSMDEEFLQEVYNFLLMNEYLFMNNQKVKIELVRIMETPFIRNKEIWLKTLSPISVYSKQDDFTTYYSPYDDKFSELIQQNLINKIEAYGLIINDPTFEILEVKDVKERMVKYKDCYYKAFNLKTKVNVSQDIFNLIYNSGLSSKGSCGFGMMETCYEKKPK